MLQSLIVCWSDKDLGINFPSCMSIIHNFVSSQVIIIRSKQLGDLLNIDSVIEWSCISDLSFVCRDLSLKTLNQVPDCHSRRNGVRINDDVRGDSFCCKRHVFLSVWDSTGSFLSMSWSKLISDLRNTHWSDSNLAKLVSVRVNGDHDLINDSCLRVS